jgi:general secretion pathway protein K
VSGAESDYYQDSNPPYVAKNGPIDDLAELVLIKGIEPEMVSREPSLAAFQAKERRLAFNKEAPSYSVVLEDLFTPFSSGTINMNTASVEVFQAVLGIDQNIASRIIEFRNQGEGMQEAAPIGSPGKGIREALLYAGFSNQAADQNARFLSVRSRTFEVTVDAELGGYKRQFVAILGRNSPRDIQVLTFYAK